MKQSSSRSNRKTMKKGRLSSPSDVSKMPCGGKINAPSPTRIKEVFHAPKTLESKESAIEELTQEIKNRIEARGKKKQGSSDSVIRVVLGVDEDNVKKLNDINIGKSSNKNISYMELLNIKSELQSLRNDIISLKTKIDFLISEINTGALTL